MRPPAFRARRQHRLQRRSPHESIRAPSTRASATNINTSEPAATNLNLGLPNTSANAIFMARIGEYADGNRRCRNRWRECVSDVLRHGDRQRVDVAETEHRRGGEYARRTPPLPSDVHHHEHHLEQDGHLQRRFQLQRVVW